MTRHIILTILFALGLARTAGIALGEWRARRHGAATQPYKMKYHALWSLLFAYLIYTQWSE